MNGFLPQMPRVAAIGDTAIRLHLRNLPSTAINQERPACQRVARQAIVPVPLLTAMPGSPGRPPQRRGQPQTDQGLTRAGVRDHGPGLRLAGQCTDADRFRFLPGYAQQSDGGFHDCEQGANFRPPRLRRPRGRHRGRPGHLLPSRRQCGTGVPVLPPQVPETKIGPRRTPGKTSPARTPKAPGPPGVTRRRLHD